MKYLYFVYCLEQRDRLQPAHVQEVCEEEGWPEGQVQNSASHIHGDQGEYIVHHSKYITAVHLTERNFTNPTGYDGAKYTKDAYEYNVYAPLVMVSIWGRKRTLPNKTVIKMDRLMPVSTHLCFH